MVKSELINNRARAKQLLAFDGMQYGKCKPTDIDVSIDFQQKCFVFVELKGGNQRLTQGQKIHLMGLVDAIVAGGREAHAILANHDTMDTSHDVHVAEATAVSVYSGNGSWEEINVKKSVDTVIQEIYASYRLSRGQC